jgi:hypothetical protein
MAELNFGLLTPPGSQSIGNAFVTGMDQAAAARAQENQNALSQYTLGKAKREDELTNQLLGDLRVATTPEEIYRAYQRVGKPDIALKMQTDALTQEELRNKLKLQPVALSAAKVKLVDDKIAQSRQYLDNISPDNPNAAQQYLAWHEANHKDPVLGPELAARGVTIEQSRARIDAALQQPGGLERLINESKVGVAKFAEMNKPSNVQRNTGNTVEILSIPGMGGAATVVPGSQAAIQISPNTTATIKAARQIHLENLAQQGWTFDTERGIGVNARLGLTKPISTLMSQTGGPLAAPVGGAPAGGAPAVPSVVPMAASTGVPGQRQATASQAPASQPVTAPNVLAPKPEKAPAEFTKIDNQLSNLVGNLNRFKQEIAKGKTTSAQWAPTGADTAAMNAKYISLLMGMKDMYTLGALTGPDLGLIEAQISNPATWGGFTKSREAFNAQIDNVEQQLKDASLNLENSYGYKPKATSAAFLRNPATPVKKESTSISEPPPGAVRRRGQN